MRSEQRLHPATLLFDLAKHVKQFAFPSLLVIFGMSRSSGGAGGNFGRLPDGWEAWLLVMFVPATLISIARYISFRVRYDERELVIRSGLIFRKERHIPFSRIQNVDAIQNAVHRLLGVVEVRLETGGGKEEEARLSVLPLSALTELRGRVFGSTDPVAPEAPGHQPLGTPTHRTHPRHPVLLHLPPREVVLFGLLENKGMVLIAAAFGAIWQTGALDFLAGQLFGSTRLSRGFFRELLTPFFDGGPMHLLGIAIIVALIVFFLIIVRVISMIWALIRLYDFRLTRVGEDLRTEYGLLTRVAATVPIRRIQAITISAGPVHRLLKRTTVRVATAGGTGNQKAANVREWLAPLIGIEALPQLLQQVVPGFDLSAVGWQPVHPRAFTRAIKPALVVTAVVTLLAWLAIGWGAIAVFIMLLLWSVFATRQMVEHLGWANDDDVVMMRSGWISQQITLARVNKIQAVALHESPFDRRAAMARVRVDTAGAGEFSHRVSIPYLDISIARALSDRLSAAAANTAFRW